MTNSYLFSCPRAFIQHPVPGALFPKPVFRKSMSAIVHRLHQYQFTLQPQISIMLCPSSLLQHVNLCSQHHLLLFPTSSTSNYQSNYHFGEAQKIKDIDKQYAAPAAPSHFPHTTELTSSLNLSNSPQPLPNFLHILI